MFKKIFVITALLCALPLLARAATLNTWVKTTGGTIAVNSGTPQTNVNGSVFKTFTVSSPISVNAASGYVIRSVTRNGVTVATSGTTYGTTMNPVDSSLQSVIAVFTLSSTAPPPTYTPVVANAGAPQTMLPGGSGTVTLNGSASTGPISAWLWTQTAGPATVTLNGATTATATFPIPATLGTYKFGLTVSGANNSSSSSVTIYVSSDPALTAFNHCESCHKTNGVGQNPNRYTLWTQSVHATNGSVMCYNCHVGALSGGHPGARATNATCVTCHTSIPRHSVVAGICDQCHNCLLYTSPSPRDRTRSRMPSSA